jgi:predicted RNase H-like nuclease (RuvC/YqgF family)
LYEVQYTEAKEKIMALTRGMLSAMDIPADKQDEIINAHVETVNAIKEERDTFKKDAEEVASLKKQVADLKEEAKTDSKYKVKYEALKTEFDEYKEQQKAAETLNAKTEAYTKLLKDAGVSEKRIEAVLKVSKEEIEALELDDEGNAKDAEELSKKIVEDWSDFIVTDGQSGVKVDNPPTSTGGGKMTKEEIMAIKDTAERQAAMLENKDLFLN